ncbi:pk-2 protein [Thysanoplusia orichalcea nucleopolyhedrovirus]|uniref:Pk-2 protein n=1 Tax=Thysanoplusia orichalcea nucleopolyhedrovirus TaxID=101850 RepID=L0CK46_9ABAC|nr:pk-2 protein [Thysanoplusia orichalcea nucleopolyhedrovirus]AGA16272.1 pk-2 protein [Thysanoplusia orichalcea nucleopolyhedrovirus]
MKPQELIYLSPQRHRIYFASPQNEYMLSDYLKHRNLQTFTKTDNRVPADFKFYISKFIDLVSAVKAVHFVNIVHHNINTNDVFMSGPNFHLYVGGMFGTLYKTFIKNNPHKITLYAAPEQAKKIYCPKNDMYSLGVVLFEFIMPFKNDLEREITLTGFRNNEQKMPANLYRDHPKLVNVVAKLIQLDYNRRPDASTLMTEMEQLLMEYTACSK